MQNIFKFDITFKSALLIVDIMHSTLLISWDHSQFCWHPSHLYTFYSWHHFQFTSYSCHCSQFSLLVNITVTSTLLMVDVPYPVNLLNLPVNTSYSCTVNPLNLPANPLNLLVHSLNFPVNTLNLLYCQHIESTCQHIEPSRQHIESFCQHIKWKYWYSSSLHLLDLLSF